jgi:hypothetical protein
VENVEYTAPQMPTGATREVKQRAKEQSTYCAKTQEKRLMKGSNSWAATGTAWVLARPAMVQGRLS